MTEVEQSETDTVSDGAGGRGRPRPIDTVQRDEQAVQLLRSGPLTREELAERLGVKSSLAYLVAFRLTRSGKARKIAPAEGARSPRYELVG